jgi:hypothetical protein
MGMGVGSDFIRVPWEMSRPKRVVEKRVLKNPFLNAPEAFFLDSRNHFLNGLSASLISRLCHTLLTNLYEL